MSSSKVLVTIKGSNRPSVKLARGETQTVVLTPEVQRLIDKGFVTVESRHTIAAGRSTVRHVAKPSSDNG